MGTVYEFMHGMLNITDLVYTTRSKNFHFKQKNQYLKDFSNIN